MADPDKRAQVEPKERRPAKRPPPSHPGNEEMPDVDVGDEKAAKALNKIQEVSRKLEPRG